MLCSCYSRHNHTFIWVLFPLSLSLSLSHTHTHTHTHLIFLSLHTNSVITDVLSSALYCACSLHDINESWVSLSCPNVPWLISLLRSFIYLYLWCGHDLSSEVIYTDKYKSYTYPTDALLMLPPLSWQAHVNSKWPYLQEFSLFILYIFYFVKNKKKSTYLTVRCNIICSSVALSICIAETECV